MEKRKRIRKTIRMVLKDTRKERLHNQEQTNGKSMVKPRNVKNV